MIAGRCGDHPLGQLISAEVRHFVVGPAQFEREHRLHVLAFEQDAIGKPLTEALGGLKRRFLGDIVDPGSQYSSQVIRSHARFITQFAQSPTPRPRSRAVGDVDSGDNGA